MAQAARGPKLQDTDWSPRLLSYEPGAFHALSFKILTTSPWGETFELRELKLPKNTELVSGRAGVCTQVLWASELVFDLVLTLGYPVLSQENTERCLALTRGEIMLEMMILIGDKLPTHPPSIKIKFKSKLISPLNSRMGGGRGAQFPYDSSQTAPKNGTSGNQKTQSFPPVWELERRWLWSLCLPCLAHGSGQPRKPKTDLSSMTPPPQH